MAGKGQQRWSRRRFLALGVPAVLIPGMLLAVALGWKPAILESVKNYHAIKTVFPDSGVVVGTHQKPRRVQGRRAGSGGISAAGTCRGSAVQRAGIAQV